jgi:hypothetical protein
MLHCASGGQVESKETFAARASRDGRRGAASGRSA